MIIKFNRIASFDTEGDYSAIGNIDKHLKVKGQCANDHHVTMANLYSAMSSFLSGPSPIEFIIFLTVNHGFT